MAKVRARLLSNNDYNLFTFLLFYMLLMNDWSNVWVMSFMSAIFLHILLVHVTRVMFAQTFAGIGLATFLRGSRKAFISISQWIGRMCRYFCLFTCLATCSISEIRSSMKQKYRSLSRLALVLLMKCVIHSVAYVRR